MNEFLNNTERYFQSTFEYNGNWYVRESHSIAGVHWHRIDPRGSKQFEVIGVEETAELEKMYLRESKLKRVLKNNE